MKKCSKCKIEKEFSEFYKNKYNKDGYQFLCKNCKSISDKVYLENSNYNIDYYLKNKEELSEKQKIYYVENKKDILEYQIKYNSENKNKILERKKEYYQDNKDKSKKYRLENREKRNLSIKKRKESDSLFKLKENIRTSIYVSFSRSGYTKKSRTHEILGCSFEDFKNHLESKFESWMTWNNYGLYNGELDFGWDIDHITPTSSAITEEELIRLNHYTNLQPLCSKVNRDIKRDIKEYGITNI
jgi:hypothetical protein